MKTFRYLDDCAILELSPEKCIGCGSCVMVCPHRVFGLKEKKAVILDRNGCMECGACKTNCPTEAIHVNLDEGCGCAAFIINRWLSTFLKKESCAGCC
jgi:NAD-dependent dihydropyrimidine dehydrogenase PreA subunit